MDDIDAQVCWSNRAITEVTVGGASRGYASPSGVLPVGIEVDHTSFDGSTSDWGSTRYEIEGQTPVCVDHSNHTGNGTDTELFNVTAPAARGTYDLTVTAFAVATACTTGAIGPVTLTDAIRVGIFGDSFGNVDDDNLQASPDDAQWTDDGDDGSSNCAIRTDGSDINENGFARLRSGCQITKSLSTVGLYNIHILFSCRGNSDNEADDHLVVRVDLNGDGDFVDTGETIADLAADTGADPCPNSGFSPKDINLTALNSAINNNATIQILFLGNTEGNPEEVDVDDVLVTGETDSAPPVVTCGPDITVEASGPSGNVVGWGAGQCTASDVLDPSVTDCVEAPASGSLFPIGTTPVICSVTDTSGNLGTGSFNAIVVDTTDPEVTCGADITEEATSAAGAAVSWAANHCFSTDVVDGVTACTYDATSGDTFGLGTTTVTCSYTDAAGNGPVSDSFDIIVEDTTDPEVTCGADITEEATSAAGAAVSWAANHCFSTDVVDGVTACTYDATSGDTFGLGTTTVTCSYTDAAGNGPVSDSFDIIVEDTTDPEVTCGADITEEATSAAGAAVSWAANHCFSTDVVDGVTACTYDATSGDTFGLGTTTVTCSYTDAAGNGPVSDSFDIIVEDTTDPEVTCGADITEEATSAAGAAVSWAANHCFSTDVVDGVTACTYDATSGDTFGLGTTTVTCSYTDAAGNGPVSDSFDIIVEDTTDPEVTCGADITEEATSAAGAAVSWAANHCFSTDVVDGVTACTYDATSGDTFGLGTTTVTCSYTDAAGNGPVSDSFDIIVEDTTDPEVTCGADITEEATSAAGAAVSWAANHCFSTDVVDGVTACTYDATSGDTFGLGTTTVTCSYTDAAGNGPVSDSFDIIVEDTTDPEVTCGADITEEATSAAGAAVSWAANHCFSTDVVDGVTACTYDATSGDTFGLGTTTVTCSYTDAAGNGPVSDSFDIIVEDTTDPEVTCGADITEEATSAAGAAVSWAANHCFSTDVVDGVTACTYDATSGDTFGLGTTTVTCSYTDAAGNGPVSDSFDIIVEDTTDPEVTCGADITEEATSAAGAAVSWAANHCFSTDVVDGVTACTYDATSGDTFGLGTTTVTCSYTDAAGNGPVSDSFDIIVEDTTDPEVTCGADITEEATSAAGAAVSWAANHCFSTDVVDGVTACTYDATSGDTFGLGTTTVTCSYTDAAGNGPVSDSFDIIVEDTTDPEVTCGADITEEATSAAGAAVSWAANHCFSTDVVDGVTACTYDATSGDTFGLGTTTVTCSYTDAAGNGPVSDSFDIIVEDTTDPEVTCGADITEEATSAAGAAVSWAANHCFSTDVVDGVTACTYDATSGDTFGLGTTTVTCSYTDAAGNGPVSDSFDIIVEDTTDPEVTCGADITEEATSAAGAVVAIPCTATDAVAGSLAVTCIPASGSTFPVGMTPVSCTAIDGFSHIGSDSVNVTVTPMPTPAPAECSGMVFDYTFVGGPGNEVINGTAGRDLLIGNGGNDVIFGMGGDDCISGGDGSDVIYGDGGNDRILGGNHGDVIYGGAGNDVVYGGAGNDVVNAEGGNDVVYGGDDNDTINGGSGTDVIYGDKGNDILSGEGDADVIDGGVGDDIISGGDGNDVISGGDGSDRVDGGNGNDTIDGGKGNDILCGGNGADTIQGGDGNDQIYGGAGNDTLLGGAGNDTVVGGDGSDTVSQNAGSGSVNTNGSNSCPGSGGSSPVGRHC